MGYMRHHGILVSGWDEEVLLTAHKKAVELWSAAATEPGLENITQLVTVPTEATGDGYRSFAILPDGSKEGWDLSDIGDWLRAAFVEFLKNQTYDDGSSRLNWVELQYGDDNNQARIVRSSDDDELARREPASIVGHLTAISDSKRPFQRNRPPSTQSA